MLVILYYLHTHVQSERNTTIKGEKNTKDLIHGQNCVKRLMCNGNINIFDICYNLNSKFNDFTINAKMSVLSLI